MVTNKVATGAATAATMHLKNEKLSSSTSRKTSSPSCSILSNSISMQRMNVPIAILSMIIGYTLYRLKTYSGDPISYLIPNFLMLTPLNTWSAKTFDYFVKYDGIIKEHTKIAEIPASEYTQERLREVSNNFKEPVVIKGMFADSPALQNWIKPGYLSSKLGHHYVPTIMKGYYNEGNGVSGRPQMLFRDSFEEILNDPNCTKYLFFPVKGPHKEGNATELIREEKALNDDVDRLIREEFDLDRIFTGFGNSKYHKTFRGVQILAGNGFEGDRTTGTYWHAGFVNNYFIQVAGVKRWKFLSQEYSSLLKPRRDGPANIALGHQTDIIENEKYMPIQTYDLEPGDVLYNPEFEFHAIQNEPGISIGIPLREMRFGRIWKNNHQYMIYTLLNGFFAKLFGISYGLAVKV